MRSSHAGRGFRDAAAALLLLSFAACMYAPKDRRNYSDDPYPAHVDTPAEKPADFELGDVNGNVPAAGKSSGWAGVVAGTAVASAPMRERRADAITPEPARAQIAA